MKFVCGRCWAKYQISEDWIRGKIITIRCRVCGSKLDVRESLSPEADGAVVAPVAAEATSGVEVPLFTRRPLPRLPNEGDVGGPGGLVRQPSPLGAGSAPPASATAQVSRSVPAAFLLAAHPGRLVVRRRILDTRDGGPDIIDRAIALGLIWRMAIPGLATVEDRAVVGSWLEITESFADGVSLASALETIRSVISVSIAIALVYDLARGLARLHAVTEAHGGPARLVHGRLDFDHVMLSPDGDICAIGLEGLRGDQAGDVRDLLAILRGLLALKERSTAGNALLGRLAQLEFESAAQMNAAMAAYLAKQPEGEVASIRRRFAAEVWARPFCEADLEALAALAPRSGEVSAPGAMHWYIGAGGEQRGPLAFTDVLRAVEAGAIAADDYVWKRGMGQWRRVRDLPELAARLAEGDLERRLVSAAPDFQGWLESAIPVPEEALRDGLLRPAALRADERSPPSNDQEPEADPAALGEVIHGYKLEAVLGRGGMGCVYRATNELNRKAAIKVLANRWAEDPEYARRFMNEGKIVNALRHPNIVDITDFVRTSTPLRVACVMDLVEAPTLESVLRERGRLTIRQAANATLQLAAALEAIHKLGVVHRDLKPSNVMVVGGLETDLSETPSVKLLDFGIAKVPWGEQAEQTKHGVIAGTPQYMAPEQVVGVGDSPVSPSADVYSLAEMFFEMVEGRPMFGRPNSRGAELDLISAKMSGPPPDLWVRAGVLGGHRIRDVVARCVAPHPSDRPSLREFCGAITEILLEQPRPSPARREVERPRTQDGENEAEIGEVIHGYRLQSLLGEGAAGRVFRGVNELGRLAAIKVLGAHWACNAEQVDRLFHEGCIVNAIRHPNIIDITDFVNTEQPRRVAYVMEYVAAPTLAAALAERRRFSVRQACNLTLQVASALQAVHRVGVVHRDLKPANLLVVGRLDTDLSTIPSVKLLDFGVAKAAAGTVRYKTSMGLPLGTPLYMAPEQARGGAVGPPADVYALGELLWEMVTGSPVFSRPRSEEEVITLLATKRGGWAPTLKVDSGVPRAALIQELVGACLVEVPDLRPTLEAVCRQVASILTALPSE